MSLSSIATTIKEKALALWLRLYANTTFYRVFWTGVAALAGLALTFQSENTQLMFAITLLGTLVSSIAREKVGEKKAAKAARILAEEDSVQDAVQEVVEVAVDADDG